MVVSESSVKGYGPICADESYFGVIIGQDLDIVTSKIPKEMLIFYIFRFSNNLSQIKKILNFFDLVCIC